MQEVCALVGPTAVGKTAISLAVARAMNAEILSCDSMQIYKGMERLTAAPTAQQRERIPHHLIACVDPGDAFSAGQYRDAALAAIGEAKGRGKRVLVVGGTGLYLEALQHGLCAAPPADPAVREGLHRAAEAEGSEVLHRRLAAVDAEAAAGIHPRDARRIVRALEVYEITGEPLSRWWQRQEGGFGLIPTVCLDRPREELYARINQRLLDMLADEALLEEARAVLERPLSHTAWQVHGLRHLKAVFEGGAEMEAIVPVWQQEVRRYAKRQLTWFRHRTQAAWITLSAIAEENAARLILEHFESCA